MISTTAECSESELVNRCGTAFDVVHRSVFVDDDERPLELAHVLGVDAEVRLQRDVDVDTLRHVNERATRPHRSVERGKLVVAGRDYGAEVLLEDFRLFLQRGIGVKEEDPLCLKVFADRVVNHL